MNIFIIDRFNGSIYNPSDRTAMIRIFETDKTEMIPLVYKEKFDNVFEYFFDDIDKESWGDYRGINNEIAKQIIKDFATIKDKIDTLIVHCRAGVSRSPAVALALNDIFELNCLDVKDFINMGCFSSHNRYVYKTMMKSANKTLENQYELS